jgi:beta-phosphoglucomutase-like phosphatase (HAD superfamily)
VARLAGPRLFGRVLLEPLEEEAQRALGDVHRRQLHLLVPLTEATHRDELGRLPQRIERRELQLEPRPALEGDEQPLCRRVDAELFGRGLASLSSQPRSILGLADQQTSMVLADRCGRPRPAPARGVRGVLLGARWLPNEDVETIARCHGTTLPDVGSAVTSLLKRRHQGGR